VAQNQDVDGHPDHGRHNQQHPGVRYERLSAVFSFLDRSHELTPESLADTTLPGPGRVPGPAGTAAYLDGLAG
jgi:hypothetical protein